MNAAPAAGAARTAAATLEFENDRIPLALAAGDPALLRAAESELGVRLITREGWLRIEGAPARVERARLLFSRLAEARAAGLAIDRHVFLFALRGLDAGEDGDPRQLAAVRIVVSAKRPPILPRTPGQLAYLRAISQSDLVLGLGPAGTGKTYLAVAAAVAALRQERVSRIILTRPAVEAGEALGFLPGNFQEKILPYLRPLYDALHDMLDPEDIQKQTERGVIEIAPLAYMRGRTLSGAFVILDEGQNATAEQMFMLLTRLGAGSKCVVTGDVTQIDLPPQKMSGLVEARDALENVPGIATVHFRESDVIRHDLVRAIIAAYREHRGAPRERQGGVR